MSYAVELADAAIRTLQAKIDLGVLPLEVLECINAHIEDFADSPYDFRTSGGIVFPRRPGGNPCSFWCQDEEYDYRVHLYYNFYRDEVLTILQIAMERYRRSKQSDV